MTNVTRTPPKTVTVQTAFVNVSTLGSNVILAAPGVGKSIRVLQVVLVSTGANAVRFLSAANNMTAAYSLAANGGLVMPFCEHGWFQCNENEGLNINLGSAADVGVTIQYMAL